MDEARRHDLEKIQKLRQQPLTRLTHKRVEKARHNINEQVKNPQLVRLRRRLVTATKQGDMATVDRLETKIRRLEGKLGD